MPRLLTLHTDLKSLKYGHDRPGGGSSNQPYIVTDINNPTTPINLRSGNDIINQIAAKDDGLVRGGVVGALNASATDTLRIKKFLYNDVKGRLFITKQVGLQLSNPLLETKKVNINIGGGPFLDFIGKAVNYVANDVIKEIGPTRIYNLLGAKTLAQVPVNAFGGHIVRHGLAAVNPDQYYIKVVADNNLNGDNRLTKLKSKFDLGNIQPSIPPAAVTSNRTQNVFKSIVGVVGTTVNAFNQISSLFGGPRIPLLPSKGSTPDSLIISQYISGPDSVYGIGSTTIRRYDLTRNKAQGDKDKQNPLGVKGGQTRDANGNATVVNYNTVDRVANGPSTYPNAAPNGTFISNRPNPTYNPVNYTTVNAAVQKYQELFNKQTKIQSGSSFETVNVNQFGIYNTQRGGTDNDVVNKNGNYQSTDNGLNIGYQNSYGDVVKINFKKWSDVARENRIGSGRTDSINLTPLFTKNNVYWYNNKTDASDTYGTEHNIRDLVKFAIQSIKTDAPDESMFMIFRAYLTQFQDSVNATWNPVKYAGRGNKFYIYDGFDRKVSIGFKVAALSEKEMAPMYSKLNYLIASLMPDYKGSVMRGSLHRLTVGNYFDAQLGVINSISYTISNESPWEIAIDEPEGGTKQLILPHIIDVSMDFTPIGAETRKENLIEDKNTYTSFLAQNNTGDDVNTIQYYHDFLVDNVYKKGKANANQNQQIIVPPVPQTFNVAPGSNNANITAAQNVTTTPQTSLPQLP